jgi:hypothetical protein
MALPLHVERRSVDLESMSRDQQDDKVYGGIA